MSDTPITDANASWVNDDFEMVPACVSRELERELAEVKQDVSIKQQIGLSLTERCDELMKELSEAAAECCRLQMGWRESDKQHKEARAEIERLKHEATSAAISGQCMMEEKDNEYVLQRNELEAARAEIDRKDALIKQMVEALESWITRLDLKLSDSIQMTNAAVEAWRLHNENRQN